MTTDETRAFSAGDLRGALCSALPEPFIPETIGWIESFPRTPSGKIDRDRVADVIVAAVRSPAADH